MRARCGASGSDDARHPVIRIGLASPATGGQPPVRAAIELDDDGEALLLAFCEMPRELSVVGFGGRRRGRRLCGRLRGK